MTTIITAFDEASANEEKVAKFEKRVKDEGGFFSGITYFEWLIGQSLSAGLQPQQAYERAKEVLQILNYLRDGIPPPMPQPRPTFTGNNEVWTSDGHGNFTRTDIPGADK